MLMDGDGEATELFNEVGLQWPRLSPDGRWLAYEQPESARQEIFVRPYPNVSGAVIKVSRDGGITPVWGPDSRELFFRRPGDDGAMMVAPFDADGPRAPQVLFNRPPGVYWGGMYSIHPDTGRFLMITPADPSAGVLQLYAAVNWFEELKRLVPTN